MLEHKSINYRCASNKQQQLNDKVYNKLYNDRLEVKQRKVDWNKENYEKVLTKQRLASKKYQANNRERMAFKRMIKYEAENFFKPNKFQLTVFN